MSTAINFRDVSKCYEIGAASRSLRSAISALPKQLLGRAAQPSEGKQHWALRDVNFDVEQGEVLGIIGANGAGKTTALKLLSRITRPTSGHIHIDGRVSALIELGAGFHPDLTGRENIYLNGVILGLTRKEIDKKLDDIIAFAELEKFIDTPVKRYSSGMYARLGFSVAAHTNPDVLLIDEVLAVGDTNFRQKCYDFIHSFVNSGHTTVFVGHDLYAIEQLCQRLVWLNEGRIIEIGNPSRVLEQYLAFMETKLEETSVEEVDQSRLQDTKVNIAQLRVGDADGRDRKVFRAGEDITVSVEYETLRPIERPHFCIWISDTPAPSPIFAANMMVDDSAPERIEGRGVLQCTFRNVPLMPRVYYVWVEVWGSDRAELLFRWQRLASFHIVDPSLVEDIELRRGAVRFAKAHGPIRVPYEWRLSQGEVHLDEVPVIYA